MAQRAETHLSVQQQWKKKKVTTKQKQFSEE
jgi:hypothetical protein